jgi:hypothetical protein
MPQWIKFISFLFCVLYVTLIFKSGSIFHTNNGPIHIEHGRPMIEKPSMLRRVLGTALVIGEFCGAILLAIDAYRREYDEPKVMPIVLATMGVFSLGITSIIYYLAWGNNPTHLFRSAASRFCSRCTQSTLDKPVTGLFTHRHIMGVRLIGSTQRCDECGSIIKTRWFWFLIPLIPFGSYRVLRAGDPTLLSAFLLTRKLPAMDWVQVSARYVILMLIAAGVGFVVWI